MKKILPFLFAALLPFTVEAQHQAVTLLPNGTGSGTLNTAGISYYSMGPFTYDFTGSTLLNAGLVASGTTITQTITQANSFVAGQPVTINSSGVWVGASANSTIALANALGVVSSTNLSGTQFTVVLNGVCVVNGGSFTVGAIYYVPLSAGIVTSTAPTVNGQYVYPLATAVSAGVLWVSTSTPSVVTNALGSSGAYTLLGNNTNATTPASALQNGIILGTPSITDTGVGIQETNSVTGYFQNLIQNTSNNAAASADYIASNDLGTSSNYYIDTGINSHLFSGTGSFNLPNAGYVYTIPGDLVLGTWASAGNIHFTIANSYGVSSSDAAGIGSGGMFVNGLLGVGEANDITGYQVDVAGSVSGTGTIGLNEHVTHTVTANSQTVTGLNINPTVSGAFSSETLNSLNIATPTLSSATLSGGYQLNIAAPASGQAGALNITSGAVNLGSGTTTSGSMVVGSLSGVLKAASGTVSGGAATTDLSDVTSGTYSPTLTGFTIVNGTGSVTATATYTKVGHLMFVNIVISPTGTATIACIAGTSFVSSSFTSAPTASAVGHFIFGGESFGGEAIFYNSAGNLYIAPTAWAATNTAVYISGVYPN